MLALVQSCVPHSYADRLVDLHQLSTAEQRDLDDAVKGFATHMDPLHRYLEQAPSEAACLSLLSRAAANGNLQAIEHLLPHVSPRLHGSQPLRWAIEQGHDAAVVRLLPLSDALMGLWGAAQSGQHAFLPLLLEAGANPTAGNSASLFLAAKHGHFETVRVLLPWCPEEPHRTRALNAALKHRHRDVVRLLLPGCNPTSVFVQAVRDEEWATVEVLSSDPRIPRSAVDDALRRTGEVRGPDPLASTRSERARIRLEALPPFSLGARPRF